MTPEVVKAEPNIGLAPVASDVTAVPDNPSTWGRDQTSVHLTRIAENTASPQDAQQILTAVFTAHDYIDCIKNLPGFGIDPQAYIDGLDQVSSCLFTLVVIYSQPSHVR